MKWALLQNVFGMNGTLVFQPSRWTQVTPALSHWSLGLSLHGVLRESFLQSNVLAQDGSRHACSETILWGLGLIDVSLHDCICMS